MIVIHRISIVSTDPKKPIKISVEIKTPAKTTRLACSILSVHFNLASTLATQTLVSGINPLTTASTSVRGKHLTHGMSSGGIKRCKPTELFCTYEQNVSRNHDHLSIFNYCLYIFF